MTVSPTRMVPPRSTSALGLIAAMVALMVVYVLSGRGRPPFDTSVLFTLAHATHGLAYLLAVASGFFLASVVYGYLALRSGSIVPGMLLHCAGDLAFAYFALLGGDYTRLFAP